jgi:hypothetical protein
MFSNGLGNSGRATPWSETTEFRSRYRKPLNCRMDEQFAQSGLWTDSKAFYERGSVLITSNLPFSKWEAIVRDPMTTASAIDRLVHHSVILELNVASYRMEHAKQRKAEDK